MAMSMIHIPRDMHVQQQLLMSPRKSLLPKFPDFWKERALKRSCEDLVKKVEAQQQAEEEPAQVAIRPTLPEQPSKGTFVNVKLQQYHTHNQDSFGLIAESIASINIPDQMTYQQFKATLNHHAAEMTFDDTTKPASIIGFPMLQMPKTATYIENKHWEAARGLLFFKDASLVFEFEVSKAAENSGPAEAPEVEGKKGRRELKVWLRRYEVGLVESVKGKRRSSSLNLLASQKTLKGRRRCA